MIDVTNDQAMLDEALRIYRKLSPKNRKAIMKLLNTMIEAQKQEQQEREGETDENC